MATSQTPQPHRHRVADPAPTDHNQPHGNPTSPAQPTTPPRPPRRRRTTGDRRTTTDAHTRQAADDSQGSTVIVQPGDFRLPDVLRHIEAGKIVLVLPQHNGGD